MTPKVSIVVPVYNTGNYLARCLDSLLAQTLNDIEIIAVNDGSTDDSEEILKQYAKRDPRIKVIDKQNGGISSARNIGVSQARGEYIGFVDSDDWVDANMYEELHNAAVVNKAGIVMCSYIREFGTHSKTKVFALPDRVYYHNQEVHTKVLRRLVGPLHEEMANPEFLDAWGTVWTKLYRAEIIKDNHIEFTDLKEIGTNEDLLFNIYASYYSESFLFINKPFYHYWRANEASFTSGYNANLFEQWFRLYSIIEAFLKDKKMAHEFYAALNNRICLSVLGFGLNTISGRNRSSIEGITELRRILADGRMKRAFRHLDLTYFSLHWKIFYLCARFRFAEGLYLMLIAANYLRQLVR